MRKIYITFGGSVYDSTTKLIVRNGPTFGTDEVWVYDDAWLTKQDFYVQNRWLWDHHHKRGFGWYAWKPYVIIDALSHTEPGDVILYTDADTYPIADLSAMFETARQNGAMLFEASGETRNDMWCKRDCFVAMNQDEERYHGAQAGVARFMLFKKGDWRAEQFLMEWIAYCVNPLCNTFDESVLGKPELPGFVEHRCEQAIMTNLAHKYGYRLYREADEGGENSRKDRDLYGQLFSQRNDYLKKIGKNATAPIQGSRYLNIPKRRREDQTRPSGPPSRKHVELLGLWYAAKIPTMTWAKRTAFKVTPRFFKELVKKVIYHRY